MPAWLVVGVGGCLGSIGRYFLGGLVLQRSGGSRFLGTLTVNLIGCLLIGVLAGLDAPRPFTSTQRLFLLTGVLGGFTTFSAFGLETFNLLRDQLWALALLNVMVQMIVGVIAVWGGYRGGILLAG